jgi:alkylated DNA repair dioxygenase AlkB
MHLKQMHHQLSLWDAVEPVDRQPFKPLSPYCLVLPDAEITLYPRWFGAAEADALWVELHQTILWQQDTIRLYNRLIPLPRLTAWYGDAAANYTYSGITMHPTPWTAALLRIKAAIEPLAEVSFNSVLLNLYRDGRDSVGWHSDDELELGEYPVIASVSLGATRRFGLRHKFESSWKHSLELEHGTVLLMRGLTQQCWQHQIPKTTKPTSPRINLTFRVIHSCR